MYVEVKKSSTLKMFFLFMFQEKTTDISLMNTVVSIVYGMYVQLFPLVVVSRVISHRGGTLSYFPLLILSLP